MGALAVLGCALLGVLVFLGARRLYGKSLWFALFTAIGTAAIVSMSTILILGSFVTAR
jgi:low affinity Fe/Cu permease